ncbi:unnamed protein product [Cercospora beticola]|nr:unnamed protein product [Cercospora beticola]
MLLSSASTVLLSLLGLCGITLALPSPLEHAIDNSQSTNLNAIQQAILAAHGQCDDSTDTCKKNKIDEKTALDGKTKCNVTCKKGDTDEDEVKDGKCTSVRGNVLCCVALCG